MKLLLIASSMLLVAVQDAKPWRIVYERDYKLWSAKEDGTDSRAEAEKANWHVLSPDGKRRLYVSDEGGRGIWVADADGRNPKRLTEKEANAGSPSWTTDGKRIVFHSGKPGWEQIWIMEADGSKPVQLTDHEGHVEDPKISPRGDRIAFVERFEVHGKVTQATLRTMDLAGGDSKILIERAPLWRFAWNPAGDRIACGMSHEIQIIGATDGKKLRTFKLADIHKDLVDHAAGWFVWRPDGGAIACSILRRGHIVGDPLEFGDHQIFVIPFEGRPTILECGGRAIPKRWTL